MSAKNISDLTAENVSVISSQTAPDTIGTATLSSFIQDIIDSYWNKIDGITVSGLVIPPAFTGLITDGDSLTSIINVLLNQFDPTMSTSTGNPYLFRATKNATPLKLGTSGTTNNVLYFEDDYTDPNFDTSNLFYQTKFVANAAMTKTFALEGVTLKTGGSGTLDTYRIRIMKNGVEVVTGATFTGGSMVDMYGNDEASTPGFVFPPIYAAGLTLAAGDAVWAELVNVYSSATTPTMIAGKFSNA